MTQDNGHTAWRADCGFHRHNPARSCTVRIGSGTIKVKTEKEARLIAAAPALLEALELVRMSFGWQMLSDETKAVIDAALLQARGEAG